MWRTILLDLDNTLIDRDTAHRRYCESYLERHCPWIVDGERSEALDEMLAVDQRGYFDRKQYCHWLSKRLPEANLSADAIWDDYRGRLAELVPRDERVLDLVDRLQGHYRLAIVSNGFGDIQRRKLGAAGLVDRFDDVFISGELGSEKPDGRIFLHALEQLGNAPEQALFVGDNPQHDIAGATNVGIATCWIAAGRSYPADLPSPDLTIQDVLEIDTVLP